MKFVLTPTYRNWFLLGLFVQVIAAWFSVGYHHPDEHFQVMEFCNYKLGYSPVTDLAWEFSAKCRPSLQPFLAYCLCRALEKMGMYNPFMVTFLLRLGMGLLTWWTTYRIVKLLLPEMITEKGRQALIWCSMFLWFVPYIGVRFSAENISGICFFLAISFLFNLSNLVINKQVYRLIIAGLLLGIAVFVRVQMAMGILGLAGWILYAQKWPFRNWVLIIASGVIAIALLACIDHWLYGVWVFSPLNYFNVNIIQHMAAKFGVEPWWYYFYKYLDIGVPPMSWVLLPLFFAGIWHKPRHLFTWVAVAFIAGHCLVSHKEIRFLFPISLAFIFLACSGFDALMQQYPGKRFYRWAIPLFVTLNSIMLIVKIFTPAHEAFKYYKAIYDYYGSHKSIIVTSEQTVYTLVGLPVNFYKPKDMEEWVIGSPLSLSYVMKNANGRPVLFLSHQMTPDSLLRGYKIEKIYCILPDWMSHFNITDWQSRSYIWSIYRVYPSKQE